MRKIIYNRQEDFLTFTKLKPFFRAVVDCSKPLSSISEINPGDCSAEQIKENIEELTTFLKSREFKLLKNPDPNMQDKLQDTESV